MSKVLTLPPSGVVLSHVIDAFDLRRWDPDGLLSTRNGTAARFFRGERIRDEAEQPIFRAAANALIEADIVPAVFLVGTPLPPQAAKILATLPQGEFLAGFLKGLATHWDEFAGALRRASAPVFSERLALVGCIQLVTIDLAVRLAAILWLTRSPIEEPIAIPWATDGGMQRWLRDLQARSMLSRDALADAAVVNEHTLDAWLDDGVRPTDENLQDLALALSAGDDEGGLLRDLRRAYGLRDLFKQLVTIVGLDHATGVAHRLVGYAVWMLGLPRVSTKPPEENDLKMNIALMLGTLGREQLHLGFVESMLNSVWREEVDPVWRTSVKAATSSWFDRMQVVTARLPPEDNAELERAFGLTPDAREQIGYLALASKAELARDPRVRAAMESEAKEPGCFGALELKLQAGDAANRGDRLLAIELLREAVIRAPCDAELHFRLGAHLWQIADVAEGMKELEIAAKLDPGWDRSHVEVAIVLLNQDRNEEALRRLEVARPLLSAPSVWLLLHLGFARERLGDQAGAIEAYEELLGLQVDHAEALDRLAHLRFLRKEKRVAAALATRAAHLGFTDVFDAWSTGFYKVENVSSRPPFTTPRHLVQLGDPWSTSRR